MATLKDIKINRNWGVRPNNNVIYVGGEWRIKKGMAYDLVRFSINELNKVYYWKDCLCLRCGLTERQIENEVKEYVKNITEKDISDYKHFLEYGEKYGWNY